MDIKNQYLISKSWIAFLRDSPWFQFRECWKSRCKLLGLQAAFLQNGSGGPGRREGDEVLVVAFTFQSHLWRGKMIAGSGEVSIAREDVQVTSCRYLCWILGRCQCHLNLNPSYRSKKKHNFHIFKSSRHFLGFEKKSVEIKQQKPACQRLLESVRFKAMVGLFAVTCQDGKRGNGFTRYTSFVPRKQF